MPCIGVIAAISNEGELNFLDRVRDEDTERGGDESGVWKAEHLCGLAFCSRLMACNDVQWSASLAREIACEQMVTEKRLPNQFTCGSDTRHGLQRFLEWLSQTGEEVLLAKRAIARARIVRAIAKEK